MSNEDKILQIAEYILLNKQKYTEQEIINNLKISQRDFDLFSDAFALDYANHIGAGKNGEEVWRLTVAGAQLYLELKRKKQQDSINSLMLTLTIIVAIMTFIQLCLAWSQSGQPLIYGFFIFLLGCILSYITIKWNKIQNKLGNDGRN